ncbi:hypothetical protein T4D_9049 [Trichinella pseudospiralis]|uniref:Uncharacterized protein n=1 Tax=Trichinella pseudospiralis TaxID=6337 RepID=A0A0V1FGR0_TRIPS|nr:hypothetical protein T4D_9049 [Trichinella pseudospiralis]
MVLTLTGKFWSLTAWRTETNAVRCVMLCEVRKLSNRTWLSAHGIWQEMPCTYPNLGIMQSN